MEILRPVDGGPCVPPVRVGGPGQNRKRRNMPDSHPLDGSGEVDLDDDDDEGCRTGQLPPPLLTWGGCASSGDSWLFVLQPCEA